MFLSVIIPTYNRAKYLSKALISLEKQDFPKADFEVLVIDDGSSDETEKVVNNFITLRNSLTVIPAAFSPREGGEGVQLPVSVIPAAFSPREGGEGVQLPVSVIPAKAGVQGDNENLIKTNLDPRLRGDDKEKKSGDDKEKEELFQDYVDTGFRQDDGRGLDLKYIKQNHCGASFARNIGIKNAKGEVMVFFDDDATVRGDWLKNIAVIMAGEHIITGRVEPLSKNIWRHFAPHYNQGDEPVESEIILEGNCAMRREVFDQVGLFDENLDYGHEGKEFLARAREKYAIKYYPQAVIYHDYAFGFFNYLYKQWRFGEKMVYLKRSEIKNFYDLVVNYKKIKSCGHKSTKAQKHKNIFLVKLIAKCGSGAHFLGAVVGYFKYKNYGRNS